jgi:hypothetical protein
VQFNVLDRKEESSVARDEAVNEDYRAHPPSPVDSDLVEYNKEESGVARDEAVNEDYRAHPPSPVNSVHSEDDTMRSSPVSVAPVGPVRSLLLLRPNPRSLTSQALDIHRIAAGEDIGFARGIQRLVSNLQRVEDPAEQVVAHPVNSGGPGNNEEAVNRHFIPIPSHSPELGAVQPEAKLPDLVDEIENHGFSNPAGSDHGSPRVLGDDGMAAQTFRRALGGISPSSLFDPLDVQQGEQDSHSKRLRRHA